MSLPDVLRSIFFFSPTKRSFKCESSLFTTPFSRLLASGVAQSHPLDKPNATLSTHPLACTFLSSPILEIVQFPDLNHLGAHDPKPSNCSSFNHLPPQHLHQVSSMSPNFLIECKESNMFAKQPNSPPSTRSPGLSCLESAYSNPISFCQ
jgi:hypothetical protein